MTMRQLFKYTYFAWLGITIFIIVGSSMFLPSAISWTTMSGFGHFLMYLAGGLMALFFIELFIMGFLYLDRE